MANVQKYFEIFHKAIRSDYDMNSTLREKRDIILDRLRKDLAEKKRPGFSELLQGSYATRTGTVPIEPTDYDIDVALRFNIVDKDFSTVEVHKWVFEGVDGHTEKVDPRGPCIRVIYKDGYHVDLVPYAWYEDKFKLEHYKLAHKVDGWRDANPPALTEAIQKAREGYSDTEDSATSTDQFRRCVRYLRRWYDVVIPEPSHEKPTGLAFNLLAINHLSRTLSLSGDSDDCGALERFATSALRVSGRLVAKKPTPEHEDILSRLSDSGMDAFKKRLSVLAGTLRSAAAEPDPIKACKSLKECFGSDFPVPSPSDTGKKSSAPAIITTSSSA